MMGVQRFDLVVVGTGSGLDVANWAVQAGWRVAIVEKGAVGGTCLNRGCIPSKMLLHSADVAETIRTADRFGIRARVEEVDFAAIVRRVREHVDGESRGIEHALLASENPRFFQGEGRFVGRKRLQVGDAVVEGERFLLATGARPAIPPVPGLRDVPLMTSTDALERPVLPESLVILGGGYIAAELGHFFGALGTRVTVVHRNDVMLNRQDREISERFTRAFARRHRVVLSARAERVERTPEGVALTLQTGERLEAQQILVAAGVKPNSDTLDLPKTGVEVDALGFVKVDEFLETREPGVFALGDAVGRYLLKHNANHEAQYAFQNMASPDAKVAVDYAAMPHAVFSSPQVAAVGETEEALRARGADYLVGRREYLGAAMGQALRDEDGLVKILVDRASREILGCHIVGTDAATLLHEVLAVMRLGGTVDDLGGIVHVHPALSEVVQRATWDLS
jgi:dihydrolipoamide dehydrogenase